MDIIPLSLLVILSRYLITRNVVKNINRSDQFEATCSNVM